MDIRLLNQSKPALLQQFQQLLEWCDHFDAASAWVGQGKQLTAVLQHAAKVRRVVVGTSNYATDPEALNALRTGTADDRVHFMPPNGALFHPKLYCFSRTSGDLQVVVGSMNWTHPAFAGHNIEAGVLLSGSERDPELVEIRTLIERYFHEGSTLTQADINTYRVGHAARAKHRAALNLDDTNERDAGSRSGGGWMTTSGDLPTLSWEDYRNLLLVSEGSDRLRRRMRLLCLAHPLLTGKRFSDLEDYQRKSIAGTGGTNQRSIDGLDWGAFGTTGNGTFKHIVAERPKRLDPVFAAIPDEGEVTIRHYRLAEKKFVKAFEDQPRRSGVPGLSRLLAMKRPDVFVCVNALNRNRLCPQLGVAPTTLSLSSYWDRVIAPLQGAPWGSAPRPRRAILEGNIDEAQLWENRVALLDAIYSEYEFPPGWGTYPA